MTNAYCYYLAELEVCCEKNTMEALRYLPPVFLFFSLQVNFASDANHQALMDQLKHFIHVDVFHVWNHGKQIKLIRL